MSNIEWTDVTWNPVRGCSRVSQGCVNCYAERQAIRHAGPGGPYEGLIKTVNGHPTWTGQIRLVPDKLAEPLHWRKPRRVFVNSMSDLFHEGVPDEYIDRVFAVMALCPQHTFQVLTKRPERMREYLRENDELSAPVRAEAAAWDMQGIDWRAAQPCSTLPARWPLPNVWLGVSVEDQSTADERIPLLLATPAAVRFVSYEPALAAVDVSRWLRPRQRPNADGYGGDHGPGWTTDRRCVDWLIVGGESGPGARPCDVAWIRSAVEQCRGAGVAVFVKQLGALARISGPTPTAPASYEETFMRRTSRKGADPTEWPADLRVRQWPATTHGRTPT